MNGFTTKPLRLSINKRLINKDELGDTLARAEGFEPCQLNADELIAHIKQGHAYCAELNGRRKADNFVATDILSVDIDGGTTLTEAIEHPFVQAHASFLYTTCSHTPEVHRFRIIFVLEETLLNAHDVKAATRSLALKLNGDPKAVDAARMFYGNTGAQITQIGMTLPSAIVDELIEQTAAAGFKDRSLGIVGSGRSTIQLPADLVVHTAKGDDILLASAPAKTEVHCPVHDDKNPSAFVVENASKQSKGVYCSACGVTHWQGQADQYDFNSFETAARNTLDFSLKHMDQRPLSIDDQAIEGLRTATIEFRNERFLGDVAVRGETTYIKSPKGSGKTEQLARIVQSNKGRVLLIGHRRALIDSMCQRLGLACYLHDDKVDEPLSIRRKRYGICLDSITKVVAEQSYDLVVIDESEQVLAHSLSRTLDGKRRHALFALINILSRAKQVIAADADLSWTSFSFINQWAERLNGRRRTQIIINQHVSPKGKIEVFTSEQHLIGDFVTSLKSSKRCFFTANSKERIQEIATQVREECPDAPILVITSEETAVKDPAAAEFIKSPAVEAKKYQAILCSPSISSGVDITFDGDECFYDVVYGLFVPQVLTHFECDQQLGRVRHPKQVKVFISPAKGAFETNLGVVSRDVLTTYLMDATIDGYTNDAIPQAIYRPDQLTDIAVAIISHQRASKNDLWRNFLHYKKQQGWEIEHVGPDADLIHVGVGILGAGRERRSQFQVDRLMRAEPLSNDEFERIERRIRNYEFASDADLARYERSAIEAFYNTAISAELISLDDRGRFRSRVSCFETMLDRTTAISLRDGIGDAKRRDQMAMLIPNANASRILLMETLSMTPIYGSFVFNPEAEFSKLGLQPFIEWVKRNRIAIQQQFNIAIHKSLEGNPITQLRPFLAMVGLDLEKLPKTRAGGPTVVPYRISQISLDQMMEISSRRQIRGDSERPKLAA
ncbi:plasmid replication protein, CyRepA1 family [Mesorhizobium sp. Cs1299R1N3]|uniref:plasmid replication protein, CyRepA1 family n=1 Tax=Mesorhizobium sp. Cs1299R1N3 TaxID=3015173 RepID=UPI00301E302F